MSLDERTITATLRTKNADETYIARAARLIGNASPFRESNREAILAICEYVCHVSDVLPNIPDDGELAENADALTYGLSDGAGLDAWDRRALDIIALQHDEGAMETLEFSVMDRAKKEPNHPVFDEVLQHLRRRGRWHDDAFVVGCIASFHHRFHRPERQLISTGRWLISRLHEDAEATLLAARRAPGGNGAVSDKTENLLPLLASDFPALFEREAEGIASQGPTSSALVLSLMLEMDASRYEEQALQLARQLPPDSSCAVAAEALHEWLPGKHRALVKSLLVRALEANTKDTRAMLLAWPALGDEAREVWALYREENQAIRLALYEQLEAQAGAASVPWLVERVADHGRWDWSSTYGGVTRSKYLVGLLRLLNEHSPGGHLDAVRAALKNEKSKPVQRALSELDGEPPPPAVSHFSGEDGYRMDSYAEALLVETLNAIDEEEETLPSPIESLTFDGHEGSILMPCLVVQGGGRTAEIELATPDTCIPEHIEMDEDDEILPRFWEAYELDEEERAELSWGGSNAMPHCVLVYEHHLVAERVASELRKRGIAFTPTAVIGTSWDPMMHPRQRLEAMCREGMLELPRERRADMAAMLYERPEKQSWLLGLSKSPTHRDGPPRPPTTKPRSS